MPTKLLTACLDRRALFTAGMADAQIVTITKTNYIPPPPGNNLASAKPQGTYSVPANEVNDDWRVAIDYGTIPNGEFELMAGGPAAVNLELTPGAGSGPFNWGQLVTTGINNPPAGLHVRVRLQRKNIFGVYTDQDTAYLFCNEQAPGGGGPGGGD